MIFELDHASITTALQEYMDKRNILNGKDFTFLMKTSRKGEKTSRAIITTVDVVVTPAVVAPVVEAVVAPVVEESPQMELPVDEVTSLDRFAIKPADLLQEPKEEPVPAVQASSTPFKKLFAA